jgi:peptide-methionine (S)-S-oxide reductase
MGDKNEVAVFGGGCFWCTEAVFAGLKGVESVVSGYSGGHAENPTYYEVCSEKTGHAEVIEIKFDPDQVSYNELLEVFFATHDPTTLNRQGADKGRRYRSVILYTGESQRDQAEAFIKDMDGSGALSNPVVTELAEFEKFYEAEEEHQRFYIENAGTMYCQIVIDPKLKKVREHFAERLR